PPNAAAAARRRLSKRVHPINKTEDSVINATYCTLSGQNPDSRSRIIALHSALNKQPLKKWNTITGRWSTRCGESRCRHVTVKRGDVGATSGGAVPTRAPVCRLTYDE